MIWTLPQLRNAIRDDLIARLKPLLTRLDGIEQGTKTLMADVTQIQQDQAAETTAIQNLTGAVGKVVASLQAEAAQIQALSDEIATLKAAGQGATQEQLDAIDAAAKESAAKIQANADALSAAMA